MLECLDRYRDVEGTDALVVDVGHKSLNELIAELCPDGVEYKALGSLTTKLVDGSHKVPPKSSAKDALPMVSAQNVVNGKLDLSFGRFVLPDVYAIEAQRTKVQRDDVLLTIVGAIGRTAIVETDDVLAFQRSVCVITTDKELLEPRFLRYVLDSDVIQNYMTANARGAAQKGFYLAQVAELHIPVPPIEVQCEIVRILDSFQELDDALTAEIEAREKQLVAYRDKLLGSRLSELCPDEVEYKALGELEDNGLIKLGRGQVISKKSIAENPGDYPIYSSAATNGGLFGCYGSWMFEDSRITWSIDGGGKFFYRSGVTRYSVTNVCGWLQVLSKNINIKYLYYALDNAWLTKIYDYSHKAHPSVIRREYIVPVPPIEVQRDIASKLDQFQSNIDVLLSERDARRNQFAYYRDRLLAFPESTS